MVLPHGQIMSKFNKETQKSVRVVLPLTLYNQIKDRCLDYGDLSRVVRHLLQKWIQEKGTIRQVYNETDETNFADKVNPIDENLKRLADDEVEEVLEKEDLT